MSNDRIVIIGGGLAGLRAAERLRELGHTGPVTMIGDEPHAPYNRPPLSKQVLEHKVHARDLHFDVYVPDLELGFIRNARAVALDPQRRHVVLANEQRVPYDGAIVATGVAPRRLPGGPDHDERVRVLRTLDDAVALDALLHRARRVLIVGGGFIGCEVASTARQRALQVTLVDLSPHLLGRVVGPGLGAAVTRVHAEAGVDLRLGRSIAAWRTSGRSVTAQLDDGATIHADVVLVAIGTAPRVDWLEGLDLDLADGVRCDETCHVVGLDDVVAAGDVARWPNRRFSLEARRVEHWINAVEMGQHAAASLLAGRAAATPFTPVPRFWSEQHGVRIQACGVPAVADRIALAEGSLESRRLVAACLRGEELVGAIALDSPRAMLRYAELVEQATTTNLAGRPTRPPRALERHRPAALPALAGAAVRCR